MQSLPVQRLTRAAFAPYGEVIDSDGAASFAINAGRAQRFHALAEVDALAENGRGVISIFRTEPVQLPLDLGLLERHRLGSQAFMPLNGQRFLVVVAPDAAGGQPGVPVAFLTNGQQGVSFRRGTWHHPLLALQARCDFLVVDRDGAVIDCEEAAPPGAFRIDSLPPG